MILPEYGRGSLSLQTGAKMPYLDLGGGDTEVVFIPGAGDGFSTAYEAVRRLAWFYRKRAQDFRVLVLSRREKMPSGYAVERHAEDYVRAIEGLARGPVVLECNSAGGPIGQIVAARRPDLVRGLVLASTAHRIDGGARAAIRGWLGLISRREWGELGWDTSAKTYRSISRLGKLKPLIKPLFGIFAKPRDPERIENLLLGLLGVDNSKHLPDIPVPTLVFGGEEDPIFETGVQREMADLVPNSRLVQVPGHLHGADLESPRYPEEFEQFVVGLREEKP